MLELFYRLNINKNYMDINKKINEFKKLTKEEKIKKILLILKELKSNWGNFDNSISYIEWKKSTVSIELIDKIFKTINLKVVNQENLTQEKVKKLSSDINNKLEFYKKQEKEEKQTENTNLENLFEEI